MPIEYSMNLKLDINKALEQIARIDKSVGNLWSHVEKDNVNLKGFVRGFESAFTKVKQLAANASEDVERNFTAKAASKLQQQLASQKDVFSKQLGSSGIKYYEQQFAKLSELVSKLKVQTQNLVPSPQQNLKTFLGQFDTAFKQLVAQSKIAGTEIERNLVYKGTNKLLTQLAGQKANILGLVGEQTYNKRYTEASALASQLAPVKQANDLQKLTKATNDFTLEAIKNSTVLGQWWSHFGRIAIGFTLAYRAMNAFQSGVQQVTSLIGDAVTQFDELATMQSKLGLWAQVISGGDVSFAEGFALASKNVLEFQRAAITAINPIQDLATAVDEFAQQGYIFGADMQKNLVKFADFTVMVAQTTGSSVRQVRQEIQALLSGNVRPENQVLRSLVSTGVITKEQLKNIKRMAADPAMIKDLVSTVAGYMDTAMSTMISSSFGLSLGVLRKTVTFSFVEALQSVSKDAGVSNAFADINNKMIALFSATSAERFSGRKALMRVLVDGYELALNALNQLLKGFENLAIVIDENRDKIKSFGDDFKTAFDVIKNVWDSIPGPLKEILFAAWAGKKLGGPVGAIAGAGLWGMNRASTWGNEAADTINDYYMGLKWYGKLGKYSEFDQAPAKNYAQYEQLRAQALKAIRDIDNTSNGLELYKTKGSGEIDKKTQHAMDKLRSVLDSLSLAIEDTETPLDKIGRSLNNYEKALIEGTRALGGSNSIVLETSKKIDELATRQYANAFDEMKRTLEEKMGSKSPMSFEDFSKMRQSIAEMSNNAAKYTGGASGVSQAKLTSSAKELRLSYDKYDTFAKSSISRNIQTYMSPTTYAEMYKELDDVDDKYRKIMEDIKYLGEGTEEYKKVAIELEKKHQEYIDRTKAKYIETNDTLKYGLTDGLETYKASITSSYDNIKDGVVQAMKKIEDSIVDAFKNGELSAGNFFEYIYDWFLRLSVQKFIMSPMVGALESIGSAFLFHSGGEVGSTFGPTRAISPLAIGSAPRLHEGLESDEYLAVLQRGETVTSKDKARDKSGGIDQVIIKNYGAQIKTEQKKNSNGGRTLVVIVSEAVKQGINLGLYDSTLGNTYGLQRQGR